MAMTLRRDGDGDDLETEMAVAEMALTEMALTEMTSQMKRQRTQNSWPTSLRKGSFLISRPVALWKGGGRRRKLLQAHLGTYFSRPVQHGAGNESSGLLGTFSWA